MREEEWVTEAEAVVLLEAAPLRDDDVEAVGDRLPVREAVWDRVPVGNGVGEHVRVA